MKKLQLSGDILSILLLSLIGLLALLLWKRSPKNPHTSPTPQPETPDLTPEEILRRTLAKAGLTPRAIAGWIAVSKFETGDFSSSLFKHHNNFFGMKHPKKRETTSIASVPPKGFASYPSRSDGASDIVHYMREFNYPNDFDSIEAHVRFMKSKGYFEEPYDYYLRGVKSKLA